MKYIRECYTGWLARWGIVRDRSADGGRRVCALLEFICFPVSLLTILCIFIQFAVEKSGLYVFPSWWTAYAMRILSSAAIGYLTNWIAIEMLFKPFHEEKWHPFSIITGGWWRQGMVPKNKAKIAAKLGEEIKGKLLNPDTMAEELCQMIESVVSKPETQAKLCAQFQTIVQQNEQSIVDFVAPRIENSIAEQFDRLIRPETVMEFWTSTIEPKLKAPETRELIANKITDGLKRRSPQIIEMLRGEVKTAIAAFVREKLSIITLLVSPEDVSAWSDKNIDWGHWNTKLNDKLASDETQTMLREEILNLVNQFNGYIHSEEAAEKVGAVIDNLRSKLREYLKDYLNTQLPKFASSLFNNDKLEKWLRGTLLPKAVVFFRDYMQREGKDLIIQKLDIAHRVEDAVNKQDMEQFYGMVNSVVAQHLGAIQVLGYALGALVGALQALML